MSTKQNKFKQNVKYYTVLRSLQNANDTDIQNELKILFEPELQPNRQEFNTWLKLKSPVLFNANQLSCHKQLNFNLNPSDESLEMIEIKFYALCRYQLRIDPEQIKDELNQLFNDKSPSYGQLILWIQTYYTDNDEKNLIESKVSLLQKALGVSSALNYEQSEKLTKLTDDYEKLKEQNVQIELDLNQMKYTVQKQQQEIEVLKSFEDKAIKYDATKIVIEQRDNEIKKIKDEVLAQQSSHYQLNTKLVTKTLENKLLKEKLNKQEQTNSELTQINKQMSQNISKLERDLDDLERNNLELKANLNELKSELIHCQKENEQLTQFKSEYLSILNEKDSFYSKIIEKNEIELNVYRDIEIKLKREQKFYLTESQKQIDDLKLKLNKSLNEYNEIKTNTSELIQQKDDQLNKLKNELNELKLVCGAIKLEKTFLSEQLDQLRRANFDYSVKNASANELCQELNNQKENLIKFLEESNTKKKELTIEIEKSFKLLEEKDALNSKQSNEINTLQLNINELKQSIAQLISEKESLLIEIKSKQNEINDAQTEACMTSLKQSVVINRLNEDINILKEGEINLSIKLKGLNVELELKQNEIKDKNGLIVKLTNELKELNSEKNYLKEEIDLVNNYNFEYCCLNLKLKKTSSMLESELKATKEKIKELTQDLDQNKLDYEKLKEDKGKIESNVDMKQVELNQLKKELNDAILQIERLKWNVRMFQMSSINDKKYRKTNKTNEHAVNSSTENNIKSISKKCLDDIISQLSMNFNQQSNVDNLSPYKRLRLM